MFLARTLTQFLLKHPISPLLIRDLEFFSVTIPLSANASGGREAMYSLIARLVSHIGVEGWGEAIDTTLPLESLRPLRNRLLPILMGRSVFNLEELIRLNLQRFDPVSYCVIPYRFERTPASYWWTSSIQAVPTGTFCWAQ